MDNAVQMILDECLDLCRELESLIQEDIDEVAHSVTGEILEQYTEAARDVTELVADMKNRIHVLFNLYYRLFQ